MNGGIQHAADVAHAVLDGPWDPDSIAGRLQTLCQTRARASWMKLASIRLLTRFPTPPHRTLELAHWLMMQGTLWRRLENVDWLQIPAATMRPHPQAAEFNIPTLCTASQVAEWLGLSLPAVDGLAGWPVPEQRRKLRGRNYLYRWLIKANGRRRLIESPKFRLKAVQRELLAGILDHVPPHPAAHAFVRGRSVATFLAPHVGRNWVLRLDLADFFATMTAARVLEVFRFLGYPERPAHLLMRLCVSAPPREVLDDGIGPDANSHDRQLRLLLTSPHLPQGAPTSPALANLSLFRFDSRLSALAGSRGVRYTRYCDDLVFSGDQQTRHDAADFRRTLLMILADEGHSVRAAKTRFMRAGRRQNVCGLNLNERLNVPRGVFDHLKAILHRCRTRGLTADEAADSDAIRRHLQGRIAVVLSVNPQRGRKLLHIFGGIVWP